MKTTTAKAACVAGLALATVVGCGDDETTATEAAGSGPTSASASASTSGAGGDPEPGAGGGAATGGAGGAGAAGGGGPGGGGPGGAGPGGAGPGAGGAGGCDTIAPPDTGSPIADPSAPCDTMLLAGEPEERIKFVEDNGSTSTITSEISLLYAFSYATRVPDTAAADYSVQEEICITKAGEAESCFVGTLTAPAAACEGPTFTPKFGIDPGIYNPGENQYRFTLRLVHQGCDVVASDSFTIVIHYEPM